MSQRNIPTHWDAVADVVVVGFGGAGAANRAACLGPAEGCCDLALTAGLASHDGLQLAPNVLLKRRALG